MVAVGSEQEWERVAAAFLEEVGAGDTPDAIELARHAGLDPTPADVERACIDATGILTIPRAGRHTDVQRWVAGELASRLLRDQQLEPTREARGYVAAALLLPRPEFARQSEDTGWNVRLLRDLYPNASIGTLAHRIGSVHGAIITWIDRGQVRWRAVSPALADRLADLTRFEQHLAEIALESDTEVNPEPRVWAFVANRKLGSAVLICDPARLLARLS